MDFKKILILSICVAISFGCTKETISPEKFGNIEGQVLDSETEEGVANVNITTTPATNSIITGSDGRFNFSEVTTGQYTVSASKSGYQDKTVNVKVREDKTATAQIYLDPKEGSGSENFEAEIIRWTETSSNDSTFAEVEFEVRNTSESVDINIYEVYFDIHTTGNRFSYEVRDTTLAPGEHDIKDFRKYIRQYSIDSISVSGTYTSD